MDLKELAAKYGGTPVETDNASLAAKFGGVPVSQQTPTTDAAALAAKFGGVPVTKESSVLDRITDIFPAMGAGAVQLGEQFINRVGEIERKAMLTPEQIEKISGVKPATTQSMLDTYDQKAAEQKKQFKQAAADYQAMKSPETQVAEQKTQEAKGFVDTAKAYLQNPSAIYTGVGESIPGMIGGAGIGRGIAAHGVEPLLAAAMGEGAISGASTAQAISDAQGGKELTPTQSLIAAGSAVLTTAFGELGGKVANKLGVEDIDKLLVAGASKKLTPEVRSKLTAAIKGAISESTFEELPQSMQEKIAQNAATGKPWDEGVAEAGAAGFMTALPAGAIAGAYGQHKQNLAAIQEKAKQEPAVEEEQLPSRNEIIKNFNKELEAAAAEAPVAPKVAPVETPAEAPVVGVLDKDTLAGFKLNPKSIAYKTLLGTDVTTPEGNKLFNDVLDNYKGKIDSSAVESFMQSVAQPTEVTAPEIKDEQRRIISGTTGEGVEVSGQPAGEPVAGRTTEPVGTTVAGIGSTTGTAEEGKVSQPAPLNIPRINPADAKVGEPFLVGDAIFIKTEEGKFERIQQVPSEEIVQEEPAPVEVKPEEVVQEEAAPEEVPVEEAPAEEAAPEEQPSEHVLEAKKLAKELARFDPTHPMIKDLRDELRVTPEDVEAARQEVEAYKATQQAKGAPTEEAPTEVSEDEEQAKLNKDLAIINAGIQQRLAPTKNIVPEEEVTGKQLLTSLANVMHAAIRKGAKSLGEAITHAKRMLGDVARHITNKEYKDAYNSAKSRATGKGNKELYDEMLRQTGTKKPRQEKESWGTKFMDAPIQTTGEIVQVIRSGLFSFDLAINKKIINAARKAGFSEEALAKIFYEIQVSNAVNSSSLSDLALENGTLEYDPNTYKFTVKKLAANMAAIRTQLIDLAKKYGVTANEFRSYASAAFIAKRSAGLIEYNNKIKAESLDMARQGKLAAAKENAKNIRLVHMTPAQIEVGLAFFDEFPELNAVFDTWNEVRSSVLNFATAQGLFSEKQKEDLLDVVDYVPFHRVEQILNNAGPKDFARGLLDATKDPKKFKGSYQEVNDVFDNMERWTKFTYRKAINNSAAIPKIKYYQQFLPDDVREIALAARSESGNTVSIWEDGKLHRYEFQGVDGNAMVKGFTGMEPVLLGSANIAMRTLSKVASFSRANIVLNPLFALTQVFMDGASAMFTSQAGLPFAIPLQVAKEIIISPLGLSTARKELKAKGIVGKHGYFDSFAKFDVATGEELKAVGSVDKIIQLVTSPLHAIGLASDNVIRQAIYAQTMLETGDEALATHLAAEVINFRRSGFWAPVHIVRQLTPFVNAGLQALHVSGSTVLADGLTPQTKAKAAARFVSQWVQIASAVLLYTAMKSDDDDYKKLDPTERDRFIILNGDYKIPLRMDFYTYIAKVVPEHVFNLLVAKSEDPTKFKKALKEGFLRATALPSAAPTFATPFIEMYFNKDTYSGSPLVNQAQESLDPELQYNARRTAEWAKYMGEQTGLSPVVLENFMQSYFSMSSMIVAAATNEYFAEKRGTVLPEKTTKETLLQYPSFSSFLVKDFGNRNQADFYELNQEVKRVVNTFKAYESFDTDKALEYLTKEHNQQIYDMSKEVEKMSSELSKLRKYENTVREDRYGRWNAQEKAAELKRIEALRQEWLGQITEVEGRRDRYVQQLRNFGGM